MSDQTPARDDLVTVTINGTTVQTEKGRLLIDVAEEIGNFIPRFCYHPGMKSVAVCRMCLVNVEGMPKLQPACATPVADGMIANTVSDEAVEAQKGVLELLLINHPLDCPICDRAGECPLQDQTYKHGSGSSRYVEEKRHYEKALDISELVVLDRERCVLCWRCVRFSDEIAGDRFIQLVDRGDGTQILNFTDDPFDSYFSGNTIQICPVGALTSKPYRFVSRPWDLETAPSVCDHCSVGCPLTNETRSGNLVRRQALPNEQVNDFWICDKGRFGYHYVSSEDRLTTPLVRSGDDFEQTGWAQALDAVAGKLKGAANVGVIAGGHLTTEDSYAIGKLARKVIGTKDVDSRIQDAGAPYEMAMSLTGVAGSNATIDDLKAASNVVWIGPDPKESLPVLYLHIHTGVRDRNLNLVVISPNSTSLDIHAAQVARVAPSAQPDALAELEGKLEGPTVVCWSPGYAGRDESTTLQAAVALAEKVGGKLLVSPPHAGSQGALDMGLHPGLEAGHVAVAEPGRDTRGILQAAADGELDALLIFGADVAADFPDADLARKALGGKAFVVCVELFPTETALLSDVVLPSAAAPEREGTFTNLERRLQKLEPLMKPPGTGREVWKTCAAIASVLDDDWGWRGFDDVWADIKSNVPTHADVDIEKLTQEAPLPHPFDEQGFEGEHPSPLRMSGPGGQYPKGHRAGAPFETGQNWPLSWELRAFEARQRPGYVFPAPEAAEAPAVRRTESETSNGSFELLSGRLIYDEGAMVSRSAALRGLQPDPFIEINDSDAKRLGIADGDSVIVSGAGSEIAVKARVNGIAEGCVFVPYDQKNCRANTLMSGVDPRVEIRRADA